MNAQYLREALAMIDKLSDEDIIKSLREAGFEARRAAPSSSADELPPLPEPDHALDCGSQPFFTAEQLRSFGHACYRMGQTAAIQAAAPADAPTINPMCELKTNHIIERDGYAKSGYVLRKEGADICVSDGGAVAWFTPEQWSWLMFNRMHTTFDWPKPIGWRAPAEDAREQQPAGAKEEGKEG